MATIFTNAINFLGATLKQTATADFLRDFQHANKLFVGDNFELVPKSGYLFHVYFDINPNLASTFMKDGKTITELGLMVKSADLPRYSIENKLYNAYNRPNLIQTKIKYDNLSINFHDDSMNVVRNFWYDYYNYYYRDTDKSEQGFFLDYKYFADPLGAFGYSRRSESNENYLRSIRIYSLSRSTYSEYILIKPIIVAFKHGEHENTSASANMAHSMTIAYENVLYSQGDVEDNAIGGYANLYYDRRPSPLNRLGTRRSVFGRRGLLDTAGSVIKDITNGNFISAIFKTATARQTFKGVNIGKAAVSEVKQMFTIGATNAITGMITSQIQRTPPGGRAVISPLSLDGVVKNAFNGIARDTSTLALLGTAALLNGKSSSKNYVQTPVTQANKTNLQNNYNPQFPRVPGAGAPATAPTSVLNANASRVQVLPTNQLDTDIRQSPLDISYDIKLLDKQIQDTSVSAAYAEKQITQLDNLLSNLNNKLSVAKSNNASAATIIDLENQIAASRQQRNDNASKLAGLKNTIAELQTKHSQSIRKLNNLR
jgi:hypothetical protein